MRMIHLLSTSSCIWFSMNSSHLVALPPRRENESANAMGLAGRFQFTASRLTKRLLPDLRYCAYGLQHALDRVPCAAFDEMKISSL